MRLLPILLCLALAGCVTDGAQAPGDARAAAPAAASASASAAKPDKPEPPKKKEWWQEGPVTRERVSAMCWMKYEQGRKDLPIDKRADLVNKCVDDTLKEHPPSMGMTR
jgi:hypothetical protein